MRNAAEFITNLLCCYGVYFTADEIYKTIYNKECPFWMKFTAGFIVCLMLAIGRHYQYA